MQYVEDVPGGDVHGFPRKSHSLHVGVREGHVIGGGDRRISCVKHEDLHLHWLSRWKYAQWNDARETEALSSLDPRLSIVVCLTLRVLEKSAWGGFHR
jgi:hypothetical protein